MSTQPKARLTPQEYLDIDRKAEYKSEYFDGEMFAMSGARRSHNLVAMNVGANLHGQLRGRPCEVYPSDMRVMVNSSGPYTYPDVTVVCGSPQFLDAATDTLLNPVVLVEVLSPSTEAYDRGRKFEHFRTIASLRQYLLVASDRVQVDLFTRQESDQWLLTSASAPGSEIELASIECRLPVAEIYEKVEFA